MTSTAVSVKRLSGDVPEGYKQPTCQKSGCDHPADWLVLGKPALAACVDHLQVTIATLTAERRG